MNYYIKNLETGKLELHFSKDDYLALDKALRQEIRRYFQFSKYRTAWVSKAKNNLYSPLQVAKKLGLEYRGEEGEKLSFEEQLNIKQEKAANRADRYQTYKDNSKKRQEALQSEFNKYRKDWAWLTQPNVNTAGGRAFTNHRNKVMARYDKGFEEMEKQNYYSDRIAAAERTAAGEQYNDPGFLQRRVEEIEAIIRKIKRNMQPYEDKLKLGKTSKYIDGKYQVVDLTEDDKIKYAWYCLKYLEQIADETDKLNFYQERLADIGGLTYSKDRLKEIRALYLDYRGKTYPIKSLNTKTVTFLNWHGIASWTWKVPYAEIKKVYTADNDKVVYDRDMNVVEPTIKY